MTATTFGQELRRLRQQQGISLAKFAELINYDASYLSRIENGRRSPTAALASACDTALHADGALATLVPAYTSTPRATGTRSKTPELVHTGWLRPSWDTGEWSIAICGSRAADTDCILIDQCVSSLSRLFTRLRCRVSHGPVGIGVEIMTFIADHYRPPGLDWLLGIVGRLNVIQPADYVLVIGGGAGTHDEVTLASSLKKILIPLPATGGTARETFRLLTNTETRPGLTEHDLDDLGTADNAEDYTRIVERILRRKADTTREPAPTRPTQLRDVH